MFHLLVFLVVAWALIEYAIYLWRYWNWQDEVAKNPPPRQIPPDDLIGRVKV